MKEFMDNTNNSNLGQKMILYIIFPFGVWVHSVFHAKSKSSYVIFFLFSLLLCWHMAPTNTEKYDDFIGILERFETTNVSTDQLTHDVEAYFSHSDIAPRDIYESILIWFVKLFTDNYHFFFLLASIPITLCQLGTMKFLTEDDRFENASILGVILLAMHNGFSFVFLSRITNKSINSDFSRTYVPFCFIAICRSFFGLFDSSKECSILQNNGNVVYPSCFSGCQLDELYRY